MRGIAQDPGPFTCNTAAPAPAPAPSAPAAGTCSFKCSPSGLADAGVVTVNIPTITCSVQGDCFTACRDRCPRPGPAGNGLSVAEGTGLVCILARPNAPACLSSNGTSINAGGRTGDTVNGPTPAPATTAANRQTANTAAELPNPVGTTNIVALLGRAVKAFLGILGALALMWFIWGGMLWMTAEESKRTEDAKVIMKNAALGIVLLFFSYGLASSFIGIFQAAAGGAAAAARSSSSNTTNTTAP